MAEFLALWFMFLNVMLVLVTSKPGKEKAAATEILDFLIPWDTNAKIVECCRWSGVVLIETSLRYDQTLEILKKMPRYIAIKSIPLENVLRSVDEVIDLITKRGDSIGGIVISKRGKFPLNTLRRRLAELGLEFRGNKIVVIEGLGEEIGITFLYRILYRRLTGKKVIPRGIVST